MDYNKEYRKDGPSSPYHTMTTRQGIELSPSSLSDLSLLPKPSVCKGYADLNENKNIGSQTDNRWTFQTKEDVIIETMYMSIFAVFGCFLRIFLAQLFGEECKNPGTVGWLKAGQPLCVTADGDTTVEDGIIFADLPANLLGSFIMGLMQPSTVLDLPKPMAVAWLSHKHPFQSWGVIHLAVRTGFCGSLTTFSSWNSEMVVMMMGVAQNTGSRVFRGLLGYLIGIETALASYILGKNIASYLHSVVNPELRVEAEETRKMKERGVFINSVLPDFERRFLSNFDMREYGVNSDLYPRPDVLERWRRSTELNRRVGNDQLVLLTHIEYQAIVLGESLEKEMIISALELGWDIEGLETWVSSKAKELQKKDTFISNKPFTFCPTLAFFLLVHALLFTGLFHFSRDDEYSITYKTMFYAALMAPTGAVLRWRLSKLNGSLRSIKWLPVGTLAANVLASIISACMVGLELRLYDTLGFWTLGSARAIKVGFAGCLSTVSTFITELAAFLKSDKPVRAYMYIILSLGVSGSLSAICYSFVDPRQKNIYY